MCEIDITAFCRDADPYDFSASVAERGEFTSRDTWNAALREAENRPMLCTAEHLEAMRAWLRATGGWDAGSISAYTPVALEALFMQFVAGDLRDVGFDECFFDEWSWSEYQRRAEAGEVQGHIYKTADGRVFYNLSV